MGELQALMELLGMLVWHPSTGALIALLLVAAVIDWRTMRIPNWLTASGTLYALAVHALSSVSTDTSLIGSAAGLAVGLLILLPLYVLRLMGAGDVKLMAMVGAFLGAAATIKAALFVLIVGGAAAIAFIVVHRATGRATTNLLNILVGMSTPGVGVLQLGSASVGKLPYGVSIAVGTVAFLVARQIGFA